MNMTLHDMIDGMGDEKGEDYYIRLENILVKMNRRIDELEADLAATVSVRILPTPSKPAQLPF